MATPKQIQINFNLSEDFRKSLHGKWVLKPGVFTKKATASTLPEKLHSQLVKYKSEVEDLASKFPEIPDPRYRTKKKVLHLSVKGGAKWCDVVTSIVDDRTSTIEDSTMATPKQIQINFNLSEDFRKGLHGEWVLKPGVFTKKAIASTLPEELHPQHKSEVEDLASEFPEIPDPRYRTKKKVFAMQLSVKGDATWYDVVTFIVDDRTSTIEDSTMATPKQIQINFNLSEDFRKSLHGEWVLKPGVFTKKAIASTLPEELHPQHKSEVEDLASEFPEIPDPRHRTKKKVFAMQLSVKGDAMWYDVVTSIVDDRTSTIEEPVIAVTGLTRRFTYTGKATTCDWTRYGIKIHFPDYDSTETDTVISASGSDDDPEKNQSKRQLNEGGENPIIVTNVRLDPSAFELPDDTELMSGIYSVTSSRPFTKPTTIELEHDLSAEDEASLSSELRFVTASPISSTSPRAVFKIMQGGIFPPGCGYGSIRVTHFSLFAIVVSLRGMISSMMQQVLPGRQQVPSAQQQVQPTQQQASVHKYSCRYFKIHQRNCFEVHMVITRDLEVFKREVESEFSARNAMYGPSQEVKFGREAILLEVPLEGIHHQGWKITPPTHPEIMKEAVDNYHPGKQIPSCSLQFKWTRDGPPVNETYTLRLQGAREPFNYFNIDCEQGMNVVQPQPEITLLTLMRINLHQDISTHYREFGAFLLLDHAGTRVRNIERKRMNDPQNINLDILQEWLEGQGRKPVTKKTLVDVLREIELHTVADRVEQVQA